MAIGASDYAASIGGDAGFSATGGTAALDTASSLLRARSATGTLLRFPVGATETEIPVESTSGLTPDGAVVIDSECVTYTGLTETSLTGCTRGSFQSDGYGAPAAHEIGAEVVQEPLAANVRVLADAVLALQARVEGLLVAVNVNAQTGATYLLQGSDHGRIVALTHATGATLYISGTLPSGFRCRVLQGGAGQVTVDGGAAATVRSVKGHTKTGGQWALVELIRIGVNDYLLTGETGA